MEERHYQDPSLAVQLNHILMRHPFPQLRQLDCVTRWDTLAGDLVDCSAPHNAPSLSQLNIKQPNLPRWRLEHPFP
jgi:hypothetical protein